MKHRILIFLSLILVMTALAYLFSVRFIYAQTVIEARKHKRQGDYKVAAALYSEAIRKNPGEFELYRELADTYNLLQDKENLKKVYEEGLKIKPDDGWFLSETARDAISQKNYGKAEQLLESALKVNSDKANLYFCLARCCQEQGKIKKAEDNFLEALNRGFNRSRVYYNLAALHESQTKNYEKTLKYYDLYLKENGEKNKKVQEKVQSFSLWMKGEELENQGKYADAIKEYEKQLAKNPNSIDLLSRLGRAYRKNCSFPEGEKIYLKALNTYPDNYYILNNLGSLYYEIERYDDAAACWQDAVKKNPKMPNAHYNLGALYTKTGRFQEAEKEYANALANGYSDTKTLLQLWYLADHYMKDKKKADSYYTRLTQSSDYGKIKKENKAKTEIAPQKTPKPAQTGIEAKKPDIPAASPAQSPAPPPSEQTGPAAVQPPPVKPIAPKPAETSAPAQKTAGEKPAPEMPDAATAAGTVGGAPESPAAKTEKPSAPEGVVPEPTQ